MDKEHIPELMVEINNWGPSPLILETAEPAPIYFYNEMGSTTGTTLYSGFGKQTNVYLLATSFRLILYEKRKRGKDRCRSYWHNLDFGEWQWRDADGFVISGMKTTPVDFCDPTKENPYPAAKWQTYFVGPSGDHKPFEDVTVFLQHYHFHQEHRYAKWNEIVSVPGLEIEGKSNYAAAILHGAKIRFQSTGTGNLDLDALWLLHTDPFKASGTEVGYIPPDSRMHPDNAPRKRESLSYSKISGGEKKKRQTAKKVRKAAKQVLSAGAQARDVVGKAQKVASVIKGQDVARKAASGANKVMRDTSLASKIKFCGNCGAPMSPGVNFCGKCGMNFAKKLLDEAKDELKGKLEEKVIEKVEEALDPKETPQKGKCPNCNRRVQPKWDFCPDCGKPLSENEEKEDL